MYTASYAKQEFYPNDKRICDVDHVCAICNDSVSIEPFFQGDDPTGPLGSAVGNGCTITEVVAGWGSGLDNNSYALIICDGCLRTKGHLIQQRPGPDDELIAIIPASAIKFD